MTLFTYFASQAALYCALARSRDIPADATVFVNTLLPFAAMIWGRRTRRRVVVHVHEVSIKARYFATSDELAALLHALDPEDVAKIGSNMREIAKRRYNLDHIGNAHFVLLDRA